jgi:predicted ATPase/DNA-binding SARP family transcriptional activator
VRPDGALTALSIRLLGPFEVHVDGQPLPRLRFRKSQAVLALLALRHERPSARDWLAGLLWPDKSQSAALQSLRNCLTDLRHALGAEARRLRSPTPRTLWLDLADIAIDVHAFDAAIARGDPEALEAAVALYRGPLLDGCVEDWIFEERQVREQAYVTAREKLAAHALARGDSSTAECHLRRAVAADLLRESAHRSLMEILAAGGSYAAALLAYRELRQRLHRELNAEPDPETQTVFQRLRAEAREKSAAGRSSGRALPSRVPAPEKGTAAAARLPSAEPLPALLRSNKVRQPPLDGTETGTAASPRPLPLRLTSFIGREQEMAAIRKQLSTYRLVTLTGVGGSGKTRLALEVAAGQWPAYPDGVSFVEFAPVTDPDLVSQTLATALGIREQSNRSLTQTLVEALEPCQLLLVLDNCEHLIAACAHLAETLLQSCPHLQLLATSREPLGIAGERVFQVPPLSVPGVQPLRHSGVQAVPPEAPEHLLQYDAIRLFAERAAAAQPHFALTAENAAVVAQVCYRLDGIPLALELAAARLKALPVETLGQRLDDLFGLLTNGRRTALPRHQTLQALVDWSYDLLTPPEQALLRRLSVFAGGCSLEAAEVVCSDFGFWILDFGLPTRTSECREPLTSSAPIPNPKSKIQNEEVLDLLARLVEKSLVDYEERAGEGRYRLLEMIREYARERLTASGEAAALQEEHARFFLAVAETAAPELAGSDPRRWLERLEREHDNLRAALAWSVESGDLDLGLRLGSALEPFWYRRGYLKEGLDHFLRLLAHPGAAAPGYPRSGWIARARALSSAGGFAELQRDMEVSRRLHEESLAIGRALGDRAVIASALLHLGGLAMNVWDVAAARPLVEEGLAIRRELGDPREIASALSTMADLCSRKWDLPAERALLEESLAIWRSLDDRLRINSALGDLAQNISFQGDQDSAQVLIEETLAAARELGDRLGIARGMHRLGWVAQRREDYLAARALFEQCLPLWRELDHKDGQIDSLFHLAFTHQQQGDSAAAYSFFEEMLALSRAWGNSTCIAASFALLGAAAGDLGRWQEAATRCAESLTLDHPWKQCDPLWVAWALAGVVRVAHTRGRPARAARLLGAAAALLAPFKALLWPNLRGDFDRLVSRMRAEIDEAEFATAWAEGQAMPIEAIIAEALEEAPAD